MNLAVAVIGLIILIIGGSIVKIYTLKDRLYKKKICFTVGGFLYVIILVSLSFGDMIEKVPEKILTGIILSIPLYYLFKKEIEKKIKGNVIYYKHDTKFVTFKRGLVFVLMVTSINLILLSLIRKRQWHMDQLLQIAAVGGGIALFISNIFILIFIHRLEKKLGAPILEAEDVRKEGKEGQT